ncbi:MAG: phage portal protein [Bacteroidales bacterium]|nr:phage portal protein [Bacteroidales bacterium]
MVLSLSAYNYTPLFNLRKSDFIDLKSGLDEYIPLGEDNLLPTQLNKLAREVPVHRAILNSKTNYVIGKGLASENDKIAAFINHPNNSMLGLADVMRRLVFDYFTHGNAWIEVVTDKQMSFLYIYHIDTSKVRLATNLQEIIIHPDWENYKGKADNNSLHLPLYPGFSKQPDGLYHAVYHIKDYEPEFYHYGLCAYFAGLRSIIITGLANVWNQSRLERQFSAPGLLIIPGVNDDADALALDEEFQKYMGGSGQKSMDVIIQYLADLSPGQSSQAAQYIEFKKNEEGNWLELHKQAEMSLITIHNWFRTLTPYSDDKSGFDRNRIIAEYEVAMASIIRPHQEMFIKHISKLLNDFNFPAANFDFINEPPVQKINPYKFIWEVRRDSGLDFDLTDPVQRQLVIQARNTFGAVTDGFHSEKDQSKPLDT